MSKKDMSLGELCRTIISETSEAVLDFISSMGQPKDENLKRAKGYTEEHTKQWLEYADKSKRARTKKGRYKADDKSTKDVNEAWVGGKAPKKGKKKK